MPGDEGALPVRSRPAETPDRRHDDTVVPMTRIIHPWFGALETDALDDVDVVWRGDFVCRGVEVEAWLWADPTTRFDVATLDALAAQLQSLDGLDAVARAALSAYLAKSPDFIDDHLAAMADHAAIRRVLAAGTEREAVVTAFVAELTLRRVGIWLSAISSHPLVADYMLDPEASDQILAVKMDAVGRVAKIAWES